MQRAVDAIERQRGRVGGSDEARAHFSARYAPLYSDLIDLLIGLGRPDEAYSVLERSRARQLLTMLAERDLSFAADVPAELDRERRRLATEYSRTMEGVARVAAGGQGDHVEAALRRLDDVRLRQEIVETEVRVASPRLAQLQYPRPLDAERAAAALEPGTLLLAYSVGEAASWVFALTKGNVEPEVHAIALGRAELAARVEGFRRRVRLQRYEPHASPPETLGDDLGELVPTALWKRVREARRVVIMPDGPLHLLSFAALPDPVRAGHPYRWMVESAPLSIVASATVLAELKGRREPARAATVVAFGDPLFSDPEARPMAAQSGLRAILRDRLIPLPYSRDEVQSLGQLYGDQAVIWVGAEATEERVKSAAGDASIVHLATHGLIDEVNPLESALALAIPETWQAGQENGILQAWEIFEDLRLDASLVTLSACETALGKEVAGEGMLGLTRAFQYAGARSVLASLWSVGDRSTSQLMAGFYGSLRAGVAKDEALHDAQMAFIRGAEQPAGASADGATAWKQPFHWAGFQLVGDWR
jgi:CHAT domain-containing protein